MEVNLKTIIKDDKPDITVQDLWGYITSRGTVSNDLASGNHQIHVLVPGLGAMFGLNDVELLITEAIKAERDENEEA